MRCVEVIYMQGHQHGGLTPTANTPHNATGDDRSWNPKHSNLTDEHMRFTDCAEGMRRAIKETDLGTGPNRVVDLDRWHVASDYQAVVDEIRAKFPTYTRSMDTLAE